MNNFNNAKPNLIEPGVSYFLNESLKQCHRFREKYNNMIFNICLFVVFLVVLCVLLLYKYRGKLTPEEIEKRETEKKQYILSKIRNYQDAKKRAHQDLITGLPHWENEYDMIHDDIEKRNR
jgi:hypothetical protein